MRKFVLVAVLLAACGRRDAQKPPGVTIAITADGFVEVDGKAVTLDELSKLLAARRDAAPLEEVGWGFHASSLPVFLDLDDDAAFGHVQWVMVVLAEEKFWKLVLPGGREARLPADRPGCLGPPPDGKALLVRVVALEDGAYAVGRRTTRDVADIGPWIAAAAHRGFLCRIGEIRTWPRTPWRHVRPLFDLLRDQCRKQVDFFGVNIPTREVRGLSPLPLPGASPQPRAWGGFVPVDYWSGRDEHALEHEDDFLLPEEELLGWLDALRQGARQPCLVTDGTLSKAASLHAEEMHRLGYFGHASPAPGNRLPDDRLAKLGWPEERRYAELLAKAETAQAAFDAIVAKPENERVLADPAFKRAGVAVAGDCWVVLLGAEP